MKIVKLLLLFSISLQVSCGCEFTETCYSHEWVGDYQGEVMCPFSEDNTFRILATFNGSGAGSFSFVLGNYLCSVKDCQLDRVHHRFSYEKVESFSSRFNCKTLTIEIEDCYWSGQKI